MEPAQDNSQLQEKLYKEHGLNDLQVEIYMATLNTEIGLEISEIQKMFPKLQTNLESLNQLLNTNLIELKSKGNQQYCKAVDLEEQSILSKLNSDQKRVYNVIKDSSTEGIWIRNIKQITGLTDHQIQQSLKHLERHYIIKSIKSVKNPAQKLYILSHLTPSSEITGGTFFTDQSFDDELVSNLMYICLNFIKDHSLSPDGKLYPIDYDLYPTLSEIHTHVRENSTADKDISEDDTLQILKVMELEQMIISYDASVPVRRYNGTTAKTSTTRYKAVHIDENFAEERLTDIPCGVCPAMDSCSVDTILCSNIGDYYKDWIN